jgi:hypothetical protein
MASAQIFGIIFILSMNPLIHGNKEHEAVILLSVFGGLSTLILFWFKAEYKRYDAENAPGRIVVVEEAGLPNVVT